MTIEDVLNKLDELTEDLGVSIEAFVEEIKPVLEDSNEPIYFVFHHVTWQLDDIMRTRQSAMYKLQNGLVSLMRDGKEFPSADWDTRRLFLELIQNAKSVEVFDKDYKQVL